MKLPVLALVCLFGVSVAWAQQPGQLAPGTVASEEEVAPSNTPAPWSVLGTWQGIHQHWAKPLTFSADGRFFVDHGDHKDYGNWKLEGAGDHLNLVLGWDGWDPETVTLVNADEFCGKVPTGQMILRRGPAARSQAAAAPSATPAPALSPDASPCGAWAWQHNAAVNTLNADGTVGHGGEQGTWRWLDQPNRKLQIDWKSGFVDTATIAPGGQTMNVTNNANDSFTVRRVVPPAN